MVYIKNYIHRKWTDLMSNIAALKKIFMLVTKRPLEFLMAAGLVIVLSLVELPLPLFMALLIDTIIPSNDTTALITIGIFLFSIRAGASGFQVFQNYLVANMTSAFAATMRQKMINKMLNLPFARFINGDANGMVTRLTVDMEKVEKFSHETVGFLIRPCLSFLFIFTIMFAWNSFLAMYCLLIVPIVVFTTKSIRMNLRESSERQRCITEDLEINAAEVFNSIRNIKAFNAQNIFSERIDKNINTIKKAGVKYQIWAQLSNEIIKLLGTLSSIGFIFFAAQQVFDNNLTLGGFIALQTMSQSIRSPIAQIMYFFTTMNSKKVALERVESVMNELPEQAEDNLSTLDLPLKDGIKFKNVILNFNNNINVLNGINLNIKPNQTVAIVGPSGAGKSSLINVLLGLHKYTQGSIEYDHQDMQQLDIKNVRANIGVVYQDAILFNNTIRYNMSVGNKFYSDTKIINALKTANAWDFVSKLPNKLDTIIGVNGIKLSGGQKQRLSIARAILAEPAILILDEATSSLDSHSENLIKIALDKILKQRTSIVIAHRLSTILNADRILVMEQGKIIAEGTHNQLIKKCSGLYYHLYTTQTDGLLKA